MAEKRIEEPILRVDAAEWDAWLAENHAGGAAVNLVITKKGVTEKPFSYAEALEVALTWGWIDSQKRSYDAISFLQRFSPRRPRSPWSKINRAKAEALIAAGRMHPAGLAEVEAARTDGRWDAAYDSASNATVPDDLAAALAAEPAARALFDELDGANRYAILYRVQTAKRPATRAARIEKLVAMLARGETIHPRRASKKSGA